MKTSIKTLGLALLAAQLFSACIIDNYDYSDGYTYSEHTVERDRRGSTTTSTTTTTTTVEEDVTPVVNETIVEKEEVIIEEEVIITEPFSPLMGSISSELVEVDPDFEVSSQYYTVTFADILDDLACEVGPEKMDAGNMAVLELNGHEVDDEFAACPTGEYQIRLDCELFPGEACLELHQRDLEGRPLGSDAAAFGMVDVTLIPAEFAGQNHICQFTTYVEGSVDLSFSYELYFTSYDLAPEDSNPYPVCTMD